MISDPGRSGVIADFDGSLAPIVDDPADARPLRSAVTVLRELEPRFGLVAIVSGRPVEFLRRVLPVAGVMLVGQYGLERQQGDGVVLDPHALPFVGAIAAVAAEAERETEGLLIERKGDVAVALHWRRRPERESQVIALGERLAIQHGLHMARGRCVIELRPPIPGDKGTAIESMVGDLRCLLVAGDDTADLTAFDAVDRLIAAGSLTHGVRVAVRSHESPEELLDRSDVVVDGPEGLVELLGHLARQ